MTRIPGAHIMSMNMVKADAATMREKGIVMDIATAVIIRDKAAGYCGHARMDTEDRDKMTEKKQSCFGHYIRNKTVF